MLTVIYTTFADATSARETLRTLIEENLAACVHILPQGLSLYTWNNKLEESAEVAALIKTLPEFSIRLKTRLEELHPYDCPAVIELKADTVNSAYLEWCASVLNDSNY